MPSLQTIPKKIFEKFLKDIGCTHVRTKGDHFIWDKDGLERPVVVPKSKQIAPFIVRTNLRTLKISPEEFLQYLKRGKKK